jgi:hypothetical protein
MVSSRVDDTYERYAENSREEIIPARIVAILVLGYTADDGYIEAY